MGELRSQDKRDKLRLIYADCKVSGKPLNQALMEALKACDEAINGATPGAFISSTSEGGGSTSFQILGDYTPVVARRLIGEMLDAYDYAVAELVVEDDAATYAYLMNYFKPIRKFRSDFSGGRYGVGYTVSQ